MSNIVFAATGRRKTSVARVRLVTGEGKITINKVNIEQYLPYKTLIQDLEQPLELTQTKGTFDVLVNVRGGGFASQSGAIRLGIARALLEASADYRSILKKAGMLTRDARVKERKKYGLKGARKAPQFSKR